MIAVEKKGGTVLSFEIFGWRTTGRLSARTLLRSRVDDTVFTELGYIMMYATDVEGAFTLLPLLPAVWPFLILCQMQPRSMACSCI